MLPAVADRPLVMKRFPNGIAGAAVLSASCAGRAARRLARPSCRRPKSGPQLVGGNLKTLLYMTQLAAISQDPWFSRVQSRICRLCRARSRSGRRRAVQHGCSTSPAGFVTSSTRSARSACRRPPAPTGCTSTSRCRRARRTTPGCIFCQIVATSSRRSIRRSRRSSARVRARGPRVYVDYLQNILGKTLATAYSARASDYAGVSTPLTWDEVDEGVRREDFTIKTIGAQAETGGRFVVGVEAGERDRSDPRCPLCPAARRGPALNGADPTPNRPTGCLRGRTSSASSTTSNSSSVPWPIASSVLPPICFVRGRDRC